MTKTVSLSTAKKNLENMMRDVYSNNVSYLITRGKLPMAKLSKHLSSDRKTIKKSTSQDTNDKYFGIFKKQIPNALEFSEKLREETWRIN